MFAWNGIYNFVGELVSNLLQYLYTVGENGIFGEIGIYMHDRGNKCIMSL